jgi:predicted transcriptional regulator
VDALLSSIEVDAEFPELYKRLAGSRNAIVVVKNGQAIGVLTKMDVITHLSKS